MPESLQALWNTILGWTEVYGMHAVIPTLVVDPAGVPWAWIFLMLIAGEAKLNIPAMLAYGFAVLTITDHLLYAVGYFGGRPLLNKLGARWPKITGAMLASENAMRGKGIWMVAFGRYLPVVGRWVGTGAALANVSYARFVLYDALGVGLTVVGFGAAAHYIGREIIGFSWFPQAVMIAYIGSTILTAAVTCYGVWRAKRGKAQSSA